MQEVNQTTKSEAPAAWSPVNFWRDRPMRRSALINALLPGDLPLLSGYWAVIWIMGRFRANADTVWWVSLVRSDASWVRRLRRLTDSRNDR